MALTGITFDPLRVYGPERIVLACKVTIGAAGAVASVSGKGWGNGPNQGSVVRIGTGLYEVTLPGRGSVHDIQVLGALVECDPADDVSVSVSVSNELRNVNVRCHLEGVATDPVDESVLHLSFLVKNSPLD